MVANVNITPAQSPQTYTVEEIHVISDFSDFFPIEQEEEGSDSSDSFITDLFEQMQQETQQVDFDMGLLQLVLEQDDSEDSLESTDDDCPTKATAAPQIKETPPIRVNQSVKKKGNKLRGITVSELGKGNCSTTKGKRRNRRARAAHPPPNPNRPYVALPGQDTPDAWCQISAPPRPVIARAARAPDGEWQVQGRRT